MPRAHVVTRRRALPLALLAALTAAGVALAAAGDITTVAGGGSNDGTASALSARLRKPRRVAWLPDGGMLISEFGEVNNGNSSQYGDGRIRELKNGQVTTVAGDGVQGFAGDGGPALAAEFNGPSDVAVLPGTGDYLIADEFNGRVRMVDSSTGNISTVAGSGPAGCETLNGPAVDASMEWVRGLAVYPNGSYLIVDELCNMIQRVTAGADGEIGTADDVIKTVAGTGSAGYSGDGHAATAAKLNNPRGVAVASDGGFYIADSLNQVVRRVSPGGVISTVAGNGVQGSTGDGLPATSAGLDTPRDVDEAPDGGFVIADSNANKVRRVAPDGTISTIVGTGSRGTGGDGGPATSAQIAEPHGVNFSGSGDLYVSGAGLLDLGNANWTVRRVTQPPGSGSPPPTPPPAPTFTSVPPTGTSVVPPITFKFTGVANASFKWRVRAKLTDQLVNGQSGTTTTGTVTITALAPGGYYFEVAQTSNGLTGPYASTAFLVQTVLPPAPTVTGLPDPAGTAPQSFTWTGDVAAGPFTWQVVATGDITVQGPTQTTGTSLTLPQALTPGAYTFQVRQADLYNNQGPWATAAFTVPTPTPPGGGGTGGGGTGGGGGGTTPPAVVNAVPHTLRAALLRPARGARLTSLSGLRLRWRSIAARAGYRVVLARLTGTTQRPILKVATKHRVIAVPGTRLAWNTTYVWRVYPRSRRHGKLVVAKRPRAVSYFTTANPG